jgi:hypothetical protein
MSTYRPWGELKWLLTKLNPNKYSFYGCLSTEERCLESFRHITSIDSSCKNKLIEIIDPVDTEEHKVNRAKMLLEYNKLTDSGNISTYDLLCPIGEIVRDINDFLKNANGKLILDITSFPKRYFFPLIKVILKSPLIDTLIITYSTPEKYCSSDLSESPMDWNHIPMFASDDPDTKYEMALVGLGFMPLGLSSLLKDKFNELELRLMFPFPPGAPLFQRTWKFIEDMQITPKVDFKKIMRIDVLNVSDAFDMICSMSEDYEAIIMAPYGPKTMSLAMCLYACLTNSPIYYTQPTAYDPKYSEGVSSCYGYCIKLNGKNLFDSH